MLLVIRAQSAIVWAAILHRSVVHHRLLRAFDENFPRAPVVIYIIGNQDPLVPMPRAALEHPHLVVLEDDLRVHATIACGTDRDRNIIEEVRADFFGHRTSLLENLSCADRCLQYRRSVSVPHLSNQRPENSEICPPLEPWLIPGRGARMTVGII